MPVTDLRTVFGELEGRFRPGRLERTITFYFTLGESQADKWTVTIGPEACSVREGKHVEQADCVLKTTKALFLQMVNERYVPGAMDFMRGRIKSNDPFLLKELQRAIGL